VKVSYRLLYSIALRILAFSHHSQLIQVKGLNVKRFCLFLYLIALTTLFAFTTWNCVFSVTNLRQCSLHKTQIQALFLHNNFSAHSFLWQTGETVVITLTADEICFIYIPQLWANISIFAFSV